uniref:Scarecrow-like protein 15-like n=1 Tax=Cymbidium ensifolium TaxID=78740 RepID=A0A3G2CI37_CYMEN|nr:scarecrow-like protein 15-like [Cymbidium ensifolium]
MKIPKTSGGDSQTVLHHPPKPLDSSPLYEPTSVLDPHITSSPSAAAAAPAGGLCAAPSFPWDPTTFPLSITPYANAASDDWPDPLSFLLADMDDPCSFFPDQSHTTPGPPEADGSHIDPLIRAAHAIEIGDLNSSLSILARLNFLLPCSTGAPLHRAAFHFKDALLSFLPIPDRPIPEPPLSAIELVRRIAAHKAFSDLSPIPQFTSFTANQTLLEYLETASSLHLIDFDLGLGGQWSSFAHDLAARSRAARLPPPPLRITAIVSDETAETALAADNLRDFARGIGLRLTVEFVRLNAIGGVRLAAGEAVAVVLTPTIFRLIGVSVLRFVRRAAARVVLVVDGEGYCGSVGSFSRRFASGLEYFAAVMEVVEAGAAAVGAGEEAVRRIERALFRPRIFAAVATAAASVGDWKELMASAGMVVAEVSEFTESQAEWLLRRAPVEGFHVARKEGALVLSWKGRELSSTSAWRCR